MFGDALSQAGRAALPEVGAGAQRVTMTDWLLTGRGGVIRTRDPLLPK